VPLLRDGRGNPLKRNFVHVEDLVAAILAALDNPLTGNKLYNICMDAERSPHI
jgi:UDP-glucose 4-epimerase